MTWGGRQGTRVLVRAPRNGGRHLVQDRRLGHWCEGNIYTVVETYICVVDVNHIVCRLLLVDTAGVVVSLAATRSVNVSFLFIATVVKEIYR